MEDGSKRALATGLILLVGIPAAGKTTLARSISRKIPGSYCVTFDDWSQDCQGTLRQKHNSIFQYVSEQLSDHGAALILDDTMHLRSMRRQYWRLCEQLCVGICFVKVECSLATAIERDCLRNPPAKAVGRATIEKIHNAMEDFAIDQKPFILNTTGREIDMELVYDRLLRSMAYFLSKKRISERNLPNEKISDSGNLVHRANLSLNGLVHEALTNASRSNVDAFIDRKNLVLNVKKSLFTQFRSSPSDIKLTHLPSAFWHALGDV